MAPSKAAKNASSKVGLKTGSSKKATFKNGLSKTAVKKGLAKNQCQRFLEDKIRYCKKTKHPTSAKYCRDHMHKEITFVTMKLTEEEGELIQCIRNNEMLSLIQRYISGLNEEDAWSEPDLQEINDFATTQDILMQLTGLVNQFKSKARI